MATQKKQLIRSSTPFEKVLEYDKEGMTLAWDVDDFGYLEPSQFKQLSKGNRDRYSVFEELSREQETRDPDEESIADGFEVSVGAGSATDRLKVTSKDSNVITRWERPDMVNVRKEQGWKIATKGHTTLRGSSDGVHRIGSKGAEELILMEIPQTKWKRMRQERRNRRKRAIEGATNQGKAEVRRLGSSPIDESSDGNFQPISREEGSNG